MAERGSKKFIAVRQKKRPCLRLIRPKKKKGALLRTLRKYSGAKNATGEKRKNKIPKLLYSPRGVGNAEGKKNRPLG